MSIPVLEIEAERAFNYALHKQHVIPGSQGSCMEEVAESLVGIHAARLITPYFAFRTRLNSIDHDDLHSTLYHQRTLVKARCMRGTLHLLSKGVFRIAHHATLARRLSICYGIYRKLGLKQTEARKLASSILTLIADKPLPSSLIEESLSSVGSGLRETTRGVLAIRAVTKELWERGNLCYLNGSSEFGAEKRLYGCTEKIYPALAVTESVNEDNATTDLVRSYIRGYGPSTLGDVVWWSGLGKTRIKRALQKLSAELVCVKITGFDDEFWVLKNELGVILQHNPPNHDWVAFLAHEDPSLKGYYTTRKRYVCSRDYNRLFNDIGESRPAIMLNGRVVGIWSLNRTTASVSKMLFEQVTPLQEGLIDYQLSNISKSLPDLLQVKRV